MSIANYEEMTVPIYEALCVTYCLASREACQQAAGECYALVRVYVIVDSFTVPQLKQALYQVLLDHITKPHYKTEVHETVVNRIVEIYELWKGGYYHVDS